MVVCPSCDTEVKQLYPNKYFKGKLPICSSCLEWIKGLSKEGKN